VAVKDEAKKEEVNNIHFSLIIYCIVISGRKDTLKYQNRVLPQQLHRAK